MEDKIRSILYKIIPSAETEIPLLSSHLPKLDIYEKSQGEWYLKSHDAYGKEKLVFDDNKNLNGEWVEIKNTGSPSVNLKGFILEDEAHHKFTFPDFVLQPGKTVKVYSGNGLLDSNSLYWGSSSAIWNNDEDTAYLYDDNRKLIDTYKYP